MGLDIGSMSGAMEREMRRALLKSVQEYPIWVIDETHVFGRDRCLPGPGNLAIIRSSFDDAALIRTLS
jgi:hypothetical protein